MSSDRQTSLSFLQKLKQKAESQQVYGGEARPETARISAISCQNCGAGRSQQDGLTRCGYCGHEFMAVELTDGIYIKREGKH